MNEYEINCSVCHNPGNLVMLAHRNTLGKIVGWVFVCKDECFEFVKGKKLKIEFVKEPE